MREAGIRRRDLLALEERRIRGARLLREGVWPAEVARRLGVHRQSVCRWARTLKRGGERALGAGRLGRPARLHREDLRRVDGRLKRGPGALGYGRWTVVRVAELILRECRVKYDPSQAWRILRRLGWSFRPSGPQPPHHVKIGRDGNPGSGAPTGGWRQWGRGGG